MILISIDWGVRLVECLDRLLKRAEATVDIDLRDPAGEAKLPARSLLR